jgi:hypothetical protein
MFYRVISDVAESVVIRVARASIWNGGTTLSLENPRNMDAIMRFYTLGFVVRDAGQARGGGGTL